MSLTQRHIEEQQHEEMLVVRREEQEELARLSDDWPHIADPVTGEYLFNRALERDGVTPKQGNYERKAKMTFHDNGVSPSFNTVGVQTGGVSAPTVLVPKANGDIGIVLDWLNKQELPYSLSLGDQRWSNYVDGPKKPQKRAARRVHNRFPHREWKNQITRANGGDSLYFTHETASLDSLQHRICTLARPILGTGGYKTYQDHTNNRLVLEVLKGAGLYKLQS